MLDDRFDLLATTATTGKKHPMTTLTSLSIDLLASVTGGQNQPVSRAAHERAGGSALLACGSADRTGRDAQQRAASIAALEAPASFNARFAPVVQTMGNHIVHAADKCFGATRREFMITAPR